MTSASGYGDGVITDDGCGVELYRLLRTAGEPEMIAALVPPGSSILDLGSGAGRIAMPLAQAGYRVTAVDASPDMLAEVKGCERVCSAIEDLALDHGFDAALLASYLLNMPDKTSRSALLASVRRHLKPDGLAIIQVRNASMLTDLTGRVADDGAIRDVFTAYERQGRRVTFTVSTEAAGKRWVQTATHDYLEETDLIVELAAADLRFEGWLDTRQEWFTACPS